MRRLVICMVLAMSCGCLCVGPPGDDGETQTTLGSPRTTATSLVPSMPTTTLLPRDRKSCQAQGGRWGTIGLNPREACNLKASDAGSECSDGGECEGSCLAELSGEELDRVEAKGRCSEYRTVVGCIALVEKGRVLRLCVD